MLPCAMPRQLRLDAPEVLHHVRVRGLERCAIFRDDTDRAVFLTRLGAVTVATGTALYAWAPLPNSALLLVRSSPAGLPRFMRRLLLDVRPEQLAHGHGGVCATGASQQDPA